MNDKVEPEVPVETQARKQIAAHFRANWVGWVIAAVGILVVSYVTTQMRRIADEQIEDAGGVSTETYNLLRGEVNTLTATVKSLEAINAQQDLRLNASIDRLDNLIDVLQRERLSTQ